MAAGGLVGYAAFGEPHWLDVSRVHVPITNLPPGLRGITIAHLSDLHASKEVDPFHLAHAVALANAARPNLIVITGDFVSSGRDYVQTALETVAPLRAPLGVYAVLGNRDHSSGVANELEAGLTRVGIRLLRNQHVQLAHNNQPFWLIGMDDAIRGQGNLAAALRGVPSTGVRLLLAHEPDVADLAVPYGIALQLSGHSHGGQIRLPLVGPLVLPIMARRYPAGLQRVGASTMWVYTSRGVGLVAPAFRFNCRPELALIQLEPAEQGTR